MREIEDGGRAMIKRHPGRLWQTTEGSDLLGLRRTPSPWARRLLWASLAVGLLLLAAVAFALLPHGEPKRPAHPGAPPATNADPAERVSLPAGPALPRSFSA